MEIRTKILNSFRGYLDQLTNQFECIFDIIEGKWYLVDVKSEWSEWWHPAIRLSLAWPSQKELFQLFYDSKITNNIWKEYVNDVFERMLI